MAKKSMGLLGAALIEYLYNIRLKGPMYEYMHRTPPLTKLG